MAEGHSGVFFDSLEVGSVRDGLSRLMSRSWEPTLIKAHGLNFSQEAFAARIGRELELVMMSEST